MRLTPFLALILAAAPAAQAEPQPRAFQDSPARTVEETITISGRVTDRDSGQPLPRARVSAYGNVIDVRRKPIATTTTDENGVYVLAGLAPSRYLVLALPPLHVASHLAQGYGSDAPFEASRAVFVNSDQFVTASNSRDVNIALSRALTIEGRVVSDDGDPIAGLSVRVDRTDTLTRDVSVRTTDDRGSFRHFGLAPGRYRVCVSPPPAGDPSSPRSIRRTCYPVPGQWFELGPGSVGGLEVRVARGKSATISGIALTSSGAPLDGGRLQFLEEGDASGKTLAIERTAGGRFAIRNVEPGAYWLFASLPDDPPTERGPRERISMPVMVDGDIDNLVVRTRQSATITGTVQFEDDNRPNASARLLVSARSEDPRIPSSMWFSTRQAAKVDDDQRFELGGIFEAVRLVVNGLPMGWVVKAILYRGRDITDQPTEFQSPDDPHPVTVVVTSRVAQLAGHVIAPVKRSLLVMLIAADRARWASRSGLVSSAPVKADGTFQMTNLPPGDYLVTVASREAIMDVLQAPTEALERLAERAQRISLAEGDRRTLTLRMVDAR